MNLGCKSGVRKTEILYFLFFGLMGFVQTLLCLQFYEILWFYRSKLKECNVLFYDKVLCFLSNW